MFVLRYAVFAVAVLASIATLLLALGNAWWLLLSTFFIALTIVGVFDLRQPHST